MILFPIAEPCSKGKQTQIWREKRSTLWAENEFFNSNMDALTVHTLYLGHCELGVQSCHQLWICLNETIQILLSRFTRCE